MGFPHQAIQVIEVGIDGEPQVAVDDFHDGHLSGDPIAGDRNHFEGIARLDLQDVSQLTRDQNACLRYGDAVACGVTGNGQLRVLCDSRDADFLFMDSIFQRAADVKQGFGLIDAGQLLRFE